MRGYDWDCGSIKFRDRGVSYSVSVEFFKEGFYIDYNGKLLNPSTVKEQVLRVINYGPIRFPLYGESILKTAVCERIQFLTSNGGYEDYCNLIKDFYLVVTMCSWRRTEDLFICWSKIPDEFLEYKTMLGVPRILCRDISNIINENNFIPIDDVKCREWVRCAAIYQQALTQ